MERNRQVPVIRYCTGEVRRDVAKMGSFWGHLCASDRLGETGPDFRIAFTDILVNGRPFPWAQIR